MHLSCTLLSLDNISMIIKDASIYNFIHLNLILSLISTKALEYAIHILII